MLPAAYTLLAKRFLEATMRAGLDEKTRVLEWKRGMVGKEGGWTYHAKGLWVTLPSASAPAADAKTGGEAAGPSITIIGSSNYTTRAHTLDLEANALVITCDEGLQRKLRREEEWLKEDAKEVGIEEFRRTERRVSVWVRISMWIVGAVGGAL
jgi:CDP-diacylglycerol--glycerol-3-phosphate 3-phosphatidyltransferase